MGETILEELNDRSSTDTTARWLAHFLAEKIELANSAPDDAEGDTVRQDCLDLVLKIWERREKVPFAIPLEEAIQELGVLLKPKPYFPAPDVAKSTTLQLFDKLIKLHKQESQVCFALWVSTLDLRSEREHLTKNPEHLSEEELQLANFLVDTQDELNGDEANVCGKVIPGFGSLPDSEREAVCREILKSISETRATLL
ncbi:hypothetical protein OO256_06415 [Pseudomonas sp. DCB_CB]|uniref:hypothetical protein n=1 Tax=Pseudomonas TaxID=286 RepID=UPI002249866E|nr:MULTISPECIES: hypothetical protein [unclassified Pseudomonas]MCX2690110.1 hypothetical protein [Pseudomonas sp. DCB_BZ]MCX2855734.1 hypothetical protein [Pseudomonas sp. DCB_CB]